MRNSLRFEILLSIPGVSEITAFALLIEMPELGSLESKQAASLAGLAPLQRQSTHGKAYIRGGRASLRQALYMPALVACRFNKDSEALYQKLVKIGNPAKVVMRKLVVLANASLRMTDTLAPNRLNDLAFQPPSEGRLCTAGYAVSVKHKAH